VTLNEDGNKYSGSFTLVAYNLDGTKAVIYRCRRRHPHHHLNLLPEPVLIRADLRLTPRPDSSGRGAACAVGRIGAPPSHEKTVHLKSALIS
jgi:hypothetical protein